MDAKETAAALVYTPSTGVLDPEVLQTIAPSLASHFNRTAGHLAGG